MLLKLVRMLLLLLLLLWWARRRRVLLLLLRLLLLHGQDHVGRVRARRWLGVLREGAGIRIHPHWVLHGVRLARRVGLSHDPDADQGGCSRRCLEAWTRWSAGGRSARVIDV